jgi:crotonobetainyl-CoA:carnitine CoA-transferase CaiB-like acyl-CoA transferase
VFLNGLKVLEIGDGVGGSFASSFLATLGASVTKVVGPNSSGDEPNFEAIDAGYLTHLQREILDRGKDVRVLDDVHALLSGGDFDVVIVDRVVHAPQLLPANIDEYVQQADEANRSVWVTLSGFGISGARRSWLGSDLTVSAASGLMTAVIDPLTNQYLTLAGSQALLSAGQAVAVGALHGLDRHRGSQRPVHVDVSAQEAVISTGPVLSCLQELFHNRAASGAARNGAPAGNFRCRDGLIRISAMEQHQWAGTAEAMGKPELATEYGTSALRVEHAATIVALVSEWCGSRSKFECEEILQARGVPASAMLTPEEFLTSKQILARNALTPVDIGDAKAQIVDAPFEVEQGEDVSGIGRQSFRLEGLRVTEISQVLAMPLAGSVLGAMGALVTKLEDPDRLDTYRRRGPYIDDVEGPDRNVFFSGMNHSKRSRLIKYDTDVEGLASILDESDVLMENLGTSRARKLKLDSRNLHSSRPTLLALSSTGFGQTGPWANFRAYADNIVNASPVAYLTQTNAGTVANVDMAWADLQTGYAVAAIVAAWALGPEGRRGAAVDLSMVELVAARVNEFIAAASLGRDAPPEDGTNHQYPFAPNALYSTADTRWLGLTVATNDQWTSLKRVFGDPTSLEDVEFSTVEGRWRNQSALDSALQALITKHDATALATLLQEHGIAASPVLSTHDLANDEVLAEEDFFTHVTHPLWGRRRLVGLPWRFVGDARVPLGSPPLLGDAQPVPAAENSETKKVGEI